MGNYKDIMAFIEGLIKRDKPFLIIKYGVSFVGITNNCYEVVTMGGGKLNYMPIDRRVAMSAVRLHELPLLHETSNRNMIWGDKRFKTMYKKLKIRYDTE